MAGSEAREVSSRVLTIPNVLSFTRLALVPVFLWLIIVGEDVLALLVLVFSSLSDFLDGVIARKFGQITRLGQLLDPAADRLFIFAALIGLSVRDVIPWWFFIIVAGRDVLLLVLGIILANFGYGPLPGSPPRQGGDIVPVLGATDPHDRLRLPGRIVRHDTARLGFRHLGCFPLLVGRSRLPPGNSKSCSNSPCGRWP